MAASILFPRPLSSTAKAASQPSMSDWSIRATTRMKFSNSWMIKSGLRAILLLAASLVCFAQTNVLNFAPPKKVTAKMGAVSEAPLTIQLRPDYHVNSNTPSDEYLIPLRLTWAAGPLETSAAVLPKPSMDKYTSSDKPMSVFPADLEL